MDPRRVVNVTFTSALTLATHPVKQGDCSFMPEQFSLLNHLQVSTCLVVIQDYIIKMKCHAYLLLSYSAIQYTFSWIYYEYIGKCKRIYMPEIELETLLVQKYICVKIIPAYHRKLHIFSTTILWSILFCVTGHHYFY